MEKIILDTDLGTDIDDSFAIAYLLAQKECELVGITTVSGEALKRAEMASAICINAGRGDIPIHSGLDNPLVHPVLQAAAKQYAEITPFEHKTDFAPNTAVDFLRKTIRENPHEITLFAIGALTNVATLFTLDPEIPSLLKRLVIMGGAFAPNEKGETIREWNIRCDVHAANIVFRNAPKDFLAVGADVTRRVFIPKEDHAPYLDIPYLKPVFAFAQTWFNYTDRVTYHDPLAAVAIFHPELFTFAKGNSTVLTDSADYGITEFVPDENGSITVATDVDIPAFFKHYYSVFE